MQNRNRAHMAFFLPTLPVHGTATPYHFSADVSPGTARDVPPKRMRARPLHIRQAQELRVGDPRALTCTFRLSDLRSSLCPHASQRKAASSASNAAASPFSSLVLRRPQPRAVCELARSRTSASAPSTSALPPPPPRICAALSRPTTCGVQARMPTAREMSSHGRKGRMMVRPMRKSTSHVPPPDHAR